MNVKEAQGRNKNKEKDMFFSESTGFYLYSSLLQANAAILSILGVFTIFRIQSIQSAIDLIKNSLVIPVFARTLPPIYPDTTEMDEFDELSLAEKKKKVDAGYGSTANSKYNNWYVKEEENR